VQLGYRVLEASTGLEAQTVWKDHRDEINLLLTDLVMPGGVTGIDLAHRLFQENPRLRVVFMSGYSAEVVGRDFPLKNAANFLTKPFPTLKTRPNHPRQSGQASLAIRKCSLFRMTEGSLVTPPPPPMNVKGSPIRATLLPFYESGLGGQIGSRLKPVDKTAHRKIIVIGNGGQDGRALHRKDRTAVAQQREGRGGRGRKASAPVANRRPANM